MLLAFATFPAGAQAITYAVDTTVEGADANPGDQDCETALGDCTLRAAVEEAGFADLGPVQTILLPPGTYGLTSSLTFDNRIELVGTGSDATTIIGNGTFRLVGSAAGIDEVSISGVTLTGGGSGGGGNGGGSAARFSGTSLTKIALSAVRVTGNHSAGAFGGGVVRIPVVAPAGVDLTVSGSRFDTNTDGGGGLTGSGILAVTASDKVTAAIADSTFAGNSVGGGGAGGTAVGGAIHWGPGVLTDSSLSVTRSTISGNQAGDATAPGYGAGILSLSTGSGVTVTQSTVSGNEVGAGGFGSAIYYQEGAGGTLAIDQSTIANNSGHGPDGYAIGTDFNDAFVTIVNSTVAGNTNDGGDAGVFAAGTSSIDVTNSILAANLTNGAPTNCSGGPLTTSGYVLTDSNCGFGAAPGIQQNVPVHLGPLQDNGGPTSTMAPAAGNTLVDQGAPACGPADQRLAPRPLGQCDIGAFENRPPGGSSGSASNLAETSAVLSGLVSDEYAPTSWRFDYGPTAAYGSSTPGGTLSDLGTERAVSDTATGLTPGTTYHYRLVVTNVSGTLFSGDQTFTTTSPAPGATGPTGPAPSTTTPGLPGPAAPSGGGPSVPGRPSAPAGPTPKRGVAIVVGPARGTVLVRPRGSRRFVKLTAGTPVPPGTAIDTRKGTVALTAARDAKGTRQTATFSQGVFVVNQTRTSALTELVLSGTELKVCGKLPKVKGSAAALSPLARKKVRRKLFGAGAGTFKTSGKYGAATVRGTKWTVADSCDRTKVSVAQGVVDVRDLSKRRTVKVRAGKAYTALAPKR